jgi:rare lipoprotein A
VKGEKMKTSLIISIILMGFVISNVATATEYRFTNVSIKKESKLVKPIKERKIIGIASWYGYESGPHYRHRPKTANGEFFNPRKLTAAHKKLPFGTKVKVTNLENDRSIVVVINDRGPFIKGRIIDLSKMAAKSIGIDGVQKVALTIISKPKTKDI